MGMLRLNEGVMMFLVSGFWFKSCFWFKKFIAITETNNNKQQTRNKKQENCHNGTISSLGTPLDYI